MMFWPDEREKVGAKVKHAMSQLNFKTIYRPFRKKLIKGESKDKIRVDRGGRSRIV